MLARRSLTTVWAGLRLTAVTTAPISDPLQPAGRQRRGPRLVHGEHGDPVTGLLRLAHGLVSGLALELGSQPRLLQLGGEQQQVRVMGAGGVDPPGRGVVAGSAAPGAGP